MVKKRRRKSKEAARRHKEQEKSKQFVKVLVGVGIMVVAAFILLRLFAA